MAMPKVLKVHGLDLSYFTGKLEAYLRGKQIPYELIEMDTGDFKRCGKATGVAQMPQVEWLDARCTTGLFHATLGHSKSTAAALFVA